MRPRTVLRPTTKLAISNLSVSSPESVFHPCSQMRRNTRRCWTQQTLLILFLHRLNDACRKTCSSQAKKTLRQPTTRVEFSLYTSYDFKLTYRENCGKLCKAFFFGGGRGRLIASDKLMTVYLLQCIQQYPVKNI